MKVEDLPAVNLRAQCNENNTITIMSNIKIVTETPIRIGRFFSSSQSTDCLTVPGATVDWVVAVNVVLGGVLSVDGTDDAGLLVAVVVKYWSVVIECKFNGKIISRRIFTNLCYFWNKWETNISIACCCLPT